MFLFFDVFARGNPSDCFRRMLGERRNGTHYKTLTQKSPVLRFHDSKLSNPLTKSKKILSLKVT